MYHCKLVTLSNIILDTILWIKHGSMKNRWIIDCLSSCGENGKRSELKHVDKMFPLKSIPAKLCSLRFHRDFHKTDALISVDDKHRWKYRSFQRNSFWYVFKVSQWIMQVFGVVRRKLKHIQKYDCRIMKILIFKFYLTIQGNVSGANWILGKKKLQMQKQCLSRWIIDLHRYD